MLIRIQIDGVVVFVKIVTINNQRGFTVFNEVDEKSRETRQHSVRTDLIFGNESFWVNGHHYKTGNMIGTPCECDRCTAKD